MSEHSAPSPRGTDRTRRWQRARLMAIFFASGFAALVYQVLWVRELGLLFGSTAEAAALTIAIFFAGITLGGWFWGRRAERFDSALRSFGILELGVAVTALGHFLLLDAYHAIYPGLYAVVGHDPGLETLAKAVIATTILLPPAFLMGGTLPLMGQHLVRRRDELGTTGSALYAINTAGGALGALSAGFVLPMALGLVGAYLLAVGIDAVVGAFAIVLARDAGIGREPSADPADLDRDDDQGDGIGRSDGAGIATVFLPAPRVVWSVAFMSGVATLGIEVVWTRLFSQVLQNSAYTYALVLTTFLVALALGATVANALCRQRKVAPVVVLCSLLGACAVVTAGSPWLFYHLTEGFTYVGAWHGWAGYLASVVLLAVPVMLIPGVILGAVLPYLLHALQSSSYAPGEAIGRLVAANTGGAILGSLTTGFLLLPVLGSVRSLMVLAVAYAVLLGVVAVRGRVPHRGPIAATAVVGTGLLLFVPPGGMQGVHLDPAYAEELVELREGTAAHVAVVQRGDGLVLRVNNYYTLGGSATVEYERNQAVIPMLTHPNPATVFFLGMGTGMTAGAALYFPVERVVVCELLAEVIDLAHRHFDPWANGLFGDPRVTIYAEDGRNCLRRSPERFDVIVSDLFTPWHAGTGNLYTLEHFRTVSERLRPGGLFAQWIPLYQVSDQELGIIVRTMQEVFPQVVMWRGDLSAERSSVALVGHMEPTPLDPDVLMANARTISGEQDLDPGFLEVALHFYAGNVRAGGLFDARPLNTDNRPLIEYLAPRTYRRVLAGETQWLVGRERDRLYEELLERTPPASDPYLMLLGEEELGFVRARF